MLVIDTDKLETGRPLRYDITTVDGRLLASAGTLVSAEHKLDWIGSGFTRVCSYVGTDYADQPLHLRPYDPVLIKRLEANMDRASEAVQEQSELIRRNEPARESQLKKLAEDLLTDVDLDVAAVLAVALGDQPAQVTEHDRNLARRCSQMSMLGMAVGTQLELSDDDRHTLGIAGLLHDISLLTVTSSAVAKIADTLPFNHGFLDHPMASAYLLESILGLNQRTCIAVAQVHEQPNGGGFPKGLPAHRIMPASRLLSIIDAYLTLTAESQPEPFPSGHNLQPCDAIAYLMHNVKNGRFDPEGLKGFIRSLSLYPIGSNVQLSDGTTALVLRSNPTEPSRPIVRLLDSSFSVTDLRDSTLKIAQPLDRETTHKKRISKSDLDKVLFR